jgi:hypothetical protein
MSDLIEEIRGRLLNDYGQTATPASDAISDVSDLLDMVDQLTRWKNEALPVISGLQELGRALDLQLGRSITGPEALAAVEQLQKSHEHDGREIARLREEVRRARVTAAQTRLGSPRKD